MFIVSSGNYAIHVLIDWICCSCHWVDTTIIRHHHVHIRQYRQARWTVRVSIRRQVICNSRFCPSNGYQAVAVMDVDGRLHHYPRRDMERHRAVQIYR